MDDALRQLLLEADLPAPPAPGGSAGSFAAGVRRRHARRRRARRVAASASLAAALVLATTVVLVRRSSPPAERSVASIGEPPAPAAPGLAPAAVPPADVLSMDNVVAAIHERTAERLMASAARRGAALGARPRAGVAATDVQRERDRAALILVYDADRQARENRAADAIAAYRRAIELFPQTHWAEVARRRLQAMQS